jgi:hypothetical protein
VTDGDIFGGGPSDPEPLQLTTSDPVAYTPDAGELARRRKSQERRRRAVAALRVDDTDSGTGLSIGGR